MRLNRVCPSAFETSRGVSKSFNTLKWFIVLQEMNNVDKVFTIGKDVFEGCIS